MCVCEYVCVWLPWSLECCECVGAEEQEAELKCLTTPEREEERGGEKGRAKVCVFSKALCWYQLQFQI